MRASTSPTAALAVAVMAAAALALAACSGSSAASTSDSNASAQSPGVVAATASLNKFSSPTGAAGATPAAIANMPDLTGKTVWWVPASNSVPIMKAAGDDLAEALKQVGAKEHVCDGNFVPTAISACLNQAVAQKPAAVVTGWVDYAMVPTAFDALQKAGVPTLIGGESPDDHKSDSGSLAFYPNVGPGILRVSIGADWIIKNSGGKADVMLLRMTDNAATLQVAAGAKAELTKNCPDCKVTTVDMATANLNRVPSAVSAALVSNPNIDYIIVMLDTDMPQVTEGINSAGRQGKVQVVAAGADQEGLQLLQQGGSAMKIDVGDSNEYTGWGLADGLFRLMAGENPGALDNGSLKVFTPQNVKNLDLSAANSETSAWFGGDAWKQGFLTAWGVN